MRALSVSLRMALPLAFCLLGVALQTADACPYSIRDAGFIVREPTPYRAYVYVDGKSGDAAVIGDALKRAARRLELPESNVVVECVDIGANPASSKVTHLPDSYRTHLPAAVLVSPSGRAHVIGPLAGRLDDSGAEAFVRSVVSSKARGELSDHLVKHWCMVVILAGASESDTSRVRRVAESAAEAVAGEMTEMARIDVAPRVVVLPHGAQGEEILAWGLGLDPGSTKEPQAAVVFGMARRLGPVLRGKEITEAALRNRFLLLGRNCTCTTDPSTLMGPAAPLVWGLDRQQEVMRTLGFDPNSPAVATTLSGVWRTIGGLDSGAGREFALSPGAGYTEFALDFDDLGEDRPAPSGDMPARRELAARRTGVQVAQAREAEPGHLDDSVEREDAESAGGEAPEPSSPPVVRPRKMGPGGPPAGMGMPGGGAMMPGGGMPGMGMPGGGMPGMGMNVPPVEHQPAMPGGSPPPMAAPPGSGVLPPLRYVAPDDPAFGAYALPPETQVTTIPAEGDATGEGAPEEATEFAPAEATEMAPADISATVPQPAPTVEAKGRRVLVIVISAIAFVVMAAVAVVVLMSMRSR